MPENATTATVPLEEALRSAIVAAWDDFTLVATPRAIRIEYLCESGLLVDDLTVWVICAGGYQQRVCDYRTGPPYLRRGEWRCWAKAHFARFFVALDFIMRHQERFLHVPDANRQGLIVIFPPTEQERAMAAAWIAEASSPFQPAPVMRARAATVAGVS